MFFYALEILEESVIIMKILHYSSKLDENPTYVVNQKYRFTVRDRFFSFMFYYVLSIFI